MFFSSFTSPQGELESFFRMLFVKSEWGYTLFGSKPMSFYDYFTKPPKEFIIHSDFSDPKLEKHFLTLEKYKHLFRSNHFLILDQPLISKKFPTSGYVRDLILINKKAFLQTVQANDSLFKARLAGYSTPQALLAEIESGKPLLTDVLNEDELLIGILLGYGAHNAQLYAQEEHLTAFSPDNFPYMIRLPLFLCDPNDSETQHLKRIYQETQKEVCEIYQHPDFLSLVLNQLRSSETFNLGRKQ